jgi:riboflavin biosynthesis pyrimidine reductase
MRRLWPDPAPIDDVAALVASDSRPRPGERPWLLVNMIASLDGAITVDGRSGGLGRPADKAMFSALRAIGDVVLAGAGTVRTEGYGPPRPTPATRAARSARGQAETPRLAIATRSVDLDFDAPLFIAAEQLPLILTCASSPAERRTRAAEVAEVIVTGDDAVDLGAAMAALHERGVGTITCEGGPQLNADLLAGDLIDEWALTLSPLLVGGPAPRSISGALPPEARAMHLDWLIEGDGLLLTRWLRDR